MNDPTPIGQSAPSARRLLSRYTAVTPENLEAMLAAIGVSSLQEIFERQIPGAMRLDHHLANGGQEVKGYGTFRV